VTKWTVKLSSCYNALYIRITVAAYCILPCDVWRKHFMLQTRCCLLVWSDSILLTSALPCAVCWRHRPPASFRGAVHGNRIRQLNISCWLQMRTVVSVGNNERATCRYAPCHGLQKVVMISRQIINITYLWLNWIVASDEIWDFVLDFFYLKQSGFTNHCGKNLTNNSY
jgi:hypothetical protein